MYVRTAKSKVGHQKFSDKTKKFPAGWNDKLALRILFFLFHLRRRSAGWRADVAPPHCTEHILHRRTKKPTKASFHCLDHLPTIVIDRWGREENLKE